MENYKGFEGLTPQEKGGENKKEEVDSSIEILKEKISKMEQDAQKIDNAFRDAIREGDMDSAESAQNLLSKYHNYIVEAEEAIEKAHQKGEEEVARFLETNKKLEEVWSKFDEKQK